MYYVSACPSSHEFRTTIKSQIGPHGATLQPTQGEHTIFRHDNTVVSMLDLYFGDHRSRARFRHSARRNDARQLRYAQICTFNMQHLTVSISNDRSETGFELSATEGSMNNCTYNVYSSFRKSFFYHFNRKGVNQATLARDFAVKTKEKTKDEDYKFPMQIPYIAEIQNKDKSLKKELMKRDNKYELTKIERTLVLTIQGEIFIPTSF
jgi:hypothetical protein